MRTFMIELMVAFGCATLFAAVLTPLVRALAVQQGALDHALSARKVHGRPIPRLGGLAIVGAFYLTLLGMRAAGVSTVPVLADPARAAGLLLGGVLIGILGLYDDLRGCRAGQKFAVQFAVAGMMYALGFRIDAVSVPFGSSVPLGAASFPLTLLWIVGVTNAFNLIDGLDGLAGGVALVAVATTLVIALTRGETALVLLCAALAGSIVGFLFYNFNPASIFMGDTGSMFLGFVLGTIAIEFSQKASAAVAILIPITALGLPLFDTALAVVRRAAGGRPIFQADREHIHHRLLQMGLSHRQAVLTLYMLSILLGTMAVALSYANSMQSLGILGGLGGVCYLVLAQLGYVGRAPELGDLAQAPASRLLLRSDDPRDIWQAVRLVAEQVGADAVALKLERQRGAETSTRTYSSGFHASGEAVRLVFRIPPEGREMATVELGWRQLGYRLEPEQHQLISDLCDEIEQALGSPQRGAGKLLRLSR
jgi:UDP-GlcNAc:undecaprenyl-phosphate GlcNAc-1-phosphate transferase